MTKKDKAKADALETLHKVIVPGDTVFTVLRHVSRSGMMRHIDCYIMSRNAPICISSYVADAIGYSTTKNGAIKVGGCGMDMGFHVVYSLASAMYPEGFTCTGERCPSNDHSNGDRDHEPHLHKSGGYALRQRWM
jgi:hypothetical protein